MPHQQRNVQIFSVCLMTAAVLSSCHVREIAFLQKYSPHFTEHRIYPYNTMHHTSPVFCLVQLWYQAHTDPYHVQPICCTMSGLNILRHPVSDQHESVLLV